MVPPGSLFITLPLIDVRGENSKIKGYQVLQWRVMFFTQGEGKTSANADLGHDTDGSSFRISDIIRFNMLLRSARAKKRKTFLAQGTHGKSSWPNSRWEC